MNWIVTKYKGEWALYDKESKAYVLFGTKKQMEARAKELNSTKYAKGSNVKGGEEKKILGFRNKLVKMNVGKNEPSLDFAIKIIDMLIDGELVVGNGEVEKGSEYEKKILGFRNKLVKMNVGKNEPSLDFAIKIIDMLVDGELVVKYAKGSNVGGSKKIYVLTGYSADAHEDNYEEGELDLVGSWDEEESKTFASKQDLIKYINDKIIYKEYAENDFDWESGEGKNIQTDVLCSYDDYNGYYPADKNEIELWKKGKKKLYNVHYFFYVMAVIPTEYAKGGSIGTWSYSIGGL
jgi:hypothetical protein